MTHEAPAIFVALEQSGFATAIRQSPWLYPAANVGHIVSLVFFVGAVAVMDVRLLGGPAPVRRYLPQMIDLVFAGKINPGKVFDLTLPLGQVAEGYRAMDERRAIKTLLCP